MVVGLRAHCFRAFFVLPSFDRCFLVSRTTLSLLKIGCLLWGWLLCAAPCHTRSIPVCCTYHNMERSILALPDLILDDHYAPQFRVLWLRQVIISNFDWNAHTDEDKASIILFQGHSFEYHPAGLYSRT